MPNDSKRKWAAERYSMERSALMLTGKAYKVLDIEPENTGAVGYTSARKTIHIAYDHEIMNGLTDIEKVAFRKGVFGHELLHQIFTDFAYSEKVLRALPVGERSVLGEISNVLEDPAIEYWAPTKLGGPLLTSLRFTIAHVYKVSQPIESCEQPFAQFINALINFGDMGLVKGHFTSKEAKDCFAKAAPIFDKGIKEPIGKKRIDYSVEIMEICKPLWENEAKCADALEELSRLHDDMGKSRMNGEGHGQGGDEKSRPKDGKAEKRRKITIKKVTKEELEKMNKNGEISSGPLPEDGDITVLVCDDEKKNEDSAIAIDGNESGKDGNEKSEASSDSKGDKEKPKKKRGRPKKDKGDTADKGKDNGDDGERPDNGSGGNSDGDENEKSDNDGKPESDGKPQHEDSVNSSNDESYSRQNGLGTTFKPSNKPQKDDGSGADDGGLAEIDEGEYEISEEDLGAIVNEINRSIEESLKADKENESDTSPLEDIDVYSSKLGKRTCLNNRVKHGNYSIEYLTQQYNAELTNLSSGIRSITNQLRFIFLNDVEEREYKMSGRVNFKRLNSGTMTSRVFDRVRAPYEKKDLAVMILVDESGSMGYDKSKAARDCCIALSEIFNNLKIPVYIIGFTADTLGYNVVHNHYITWKNTMNERLKLLNISARCNNCDGYSIRYATEVLKKRQAKNKLLVVISDGQPAAYDYSNGVSDTKDAIKDAKRVASVLGVAIGNSDTNTIYGMYQNNFLHISNVNQLFAGLSGELKNIIKKWE